MKVLLLNPLYTKPVGKKYERYFIRSGSRWPHSGVKLKNRLPHYLPFPFFLARAAAYLKNLSLNVKVIDAVALNLAPEQLLDELGHLRPQVVFYEFTTLTCVQDLALAKKIKDLTGAIMVAGGSHAAYFAAQILREHQYIDFVMRGENEQVLGDLVQDLENGRQPDSAWVLYLSAGKVADRGPLAEDARFYGLTTPLREIFPANKCSDPTLYWDGFCQLRPALQLQSSCGCKYQCAFCLSAQDGSSGRKYRVTPARQISDEIALALKKYRIQEFYFDDDDFAQDLGQVNRIFTCLRDQGIKIKWSAMASLANLSLPVIEQFFDYGCIGLKLGIESASQRVLKSMHKSLDLKNIPGIISCCRKHGIKTQLTFSLGFLGETLDEIRQTIFFAQSLDADAIQVSIVTPLPGTEFFEIAKRQNALNDFNWENYDGKRRSAIIFPDFDAKLLGGLRRNFLRRWLIRKICSPFWWCRHWRVILRTLRGWGLIFCCQQIKAALIDESQNR